MARSHSALRLMTEMIAICFFMEAALYGRRYRQVKAGVHG
ncbi:hypothetical protein MPQ_0238 [Methylovorus sp. MP688]|nr:hypothetical protein MPQ_0238 [Methylovorus sp. MP688]